MRVMFFAATGALRCSSLRLSALRTSAARRGVALHATTSAARQARRAALNEGPYAGKTVADLKVLLKERGLPVSGVKATLIERLAGSDGGALAASPPRRGGAALNKVVAAAAPPKNVQK